MEKMFTKYNLLHQIHILIIFLSLLSISLSILPPDCIQASRYKYYIYPWSENLTNSWPTTSTDTGDYKVAFAENYGTGRVIQADIGLHSTFQFGLFKFFYERALIDSRRTLNPDEATAFLIPYDSGMDATHNEKGHIRPIDCPKAKSVIHELEKSVYFKRSYGHDHFVIHSINQAMFFFNRKPRCKEFLGHYCFNCTKLAIDTYPDNYPFSPNWNAVPFPSNYHWSTNVTQPPWLDFETPRPFAVSYTGSVFSHSRKVSKFRKRLVELCEKHPGKCLLSSMDSHSSGASAVQWNASLSSTFCLTPPGDMPTRKGFFDAILSGCIPVVFDKFSAHDQWQWNLGLDRAMAMSYFVSYADVERTTHNPQDLIERLYDMHLTSGLVPLYRRAIAEYASVLQYRVPEDDLKGKTPPRDAFDVIIDNVLYINRDRENLVKHPYNRGDHGEKFKNYTKHIWTDYHSLYPPSEKDNK